MGRAHRAHWPRALARLRRTARARPRAGATRYRSLLLIAGPAARSSLGFRVCSSVASEFSSVSCLVRRTGGTLQGGHAAACCSKGFRVQGFGFRVMRVFQVRGVFGWGEGFDRVWGGLGGAHPRPRQTAAASKDKKLHLGLHRCRRGRILIEGTRV